MVRNIDFPEALVFFDTSSSAPDNDASVFLEDDGTTLRVGLLDLLQECKDVSTPALFLSTQQQQQPTAPPEELASYLIPFESSSKDPSRLLWQAIHSITIQPEGFGGSSGFGRKAADPERSPYPKHTVVFGTDYEVCRAARRVGMRVLCLQDNDLADGIIDDYSYLYLQDIATPGSFWLNPSYPRDDEGDKVDVEALMNRPEEEEEDNGEEAEAVSAEEAEEELSDEDLAAILNDMEPL